MTTHSNHDREAAARSRCNPLTWLELQSIISTGDLHKLARSEEQEQIYRIARSKVRLIFLCSYCNSAIATALHTFTYNGSSPCELNSTQHGQHLLQVDQE